MKVIMFILLGTLIALAVIIVPSFFKEDIGTADDTIPQAYEGKLTDFNIQGVSRYEDIYIQVELDSTIIVVAEIADKYMWEQVTSVPLVYGWRYTLVVDGGTLVDFRKSSEFIDSEDIGEGTG